MKDLKYLIRLISSEDHDISRDELVELIKETGTDRYDPDRKQVFDHFYGKHNVHFFAEKTDSDDYESLLQESITRLPERTKGDRGKAVFPDIAIVYDAAKCEMIMNVYDDHEASDCFRFKGNPRDALVEVRKLSTIGG
ncbi:hypothetical protein KC973_04115 [Candidatus Saccharibacteria bacterium]|nr:hypothetical protein [Candidatus Saccharibacteria bacterium]